MTTAAALRYRLAAPVYDVISFERFVYGDGRRVGVEMLQLHAGDRVLDVACGTGLNFPLLAVRVGDRGQVVGLDASPQMAARARARVDRHGWRNVDVMVGDAAGDDASNAQEQPFDAAIFTYALSVIRDWRVAWDVTVAAVRPGGRMVVVDLGLPIGAGRWARPLARAACAAGGSDPYRAPWQLVVDRATDVTTATRMAGHIHVAAGTLRGRSA